MLRDSDGNHSLTAHSVDGDVSDFAAEATRYCQWARDVRLGEDLVAAMQILQVRLLKLHLAWTGVGPQGGELSDIEVDREDSNPIRQKFCALPIDGYLSVFNPLDFDAKDEPVMSSLPDDVGDIFGDLAEGLQHWEQGRRYHAYWHWNVSYDHWGRHLVGALTVLSEYLSGYPDGSHGQRVRVWNDAPE